MYDPYLQNKIGFRPDFASDSENNELISLSDLSLSDSESNELKSPSVRLSVCPSLFLSAFWKTESWSHINTITSDSGDESMPTINALKGPTVIPQGWWQNISTKRFCSLLFSVPEASHDPILTKYRT